MFSKELENLIQATLEDGVLEENEKAALVKRAEREGVDIAELEIYINSLLQKRARELENEKNAVRKQAEKEKKEAFGRKCPNCGAQVPPLTLKCECGYEFTKKESVSSVQLLSDKIYAIQSKAYQSKPDSDEYKTEKQDRNKQVRDAITLFPVPNTKEDIIEFLALSAPNSKIKGGVLGSVKGRLKIAIPLGLVSMIIVCIVMIASFGTLGDGGAELGLLMGLCYGALAAYGIFHVCLKRGTDILEENKTAEVWRSKYDQVLMKGRSLRGDAEFTQQLDYYESMLKK